MTYDAGHPCCADYGIMLRQIASLTAALQLAVARLSETEPSDSRAVSDEFVALAAVSVGDITPDVMTIIDKALAEAQP